MGLLEEITCLYGGVTMMAAHTSLLSLLTPVHQAIPLSSLTVMKEHAPGSIWTRRQKKLSGYYMSSLILCQKRSLHFLRRLLSARSVSSIQTGSCCAAYNSNRTIGDVYGIRWASAYCRNTKRRCGYILGNRALG